MHHSIESQIPGSPEREIKARAASLGFSICGITSTDPLEHHGRYVDWLQRGLHADMSYLASPFHVSSRQSPEKLFAGLKSIIVLGLPYPLHHPLQLENSPIGMISGYAIGEDYHVRIPRMLEPLLQFISSLDPNVPLPRVFTDSAPILERELAVRAGLGWIGRNSCLISPTHGSNILLAEIFTGVLLKADHPFDGDRCGTCNRCVEACPTRCILPDREIDARLCISYHNIENKGEIPEAVMERFGSWIFGCDICQMVCPWNHRAIDTNEAQNMAQKMSITEMLDFLESSPVDFQQIFESSAVARARWKGLLRNIIIRLANLKAEKAILPIRKFTLSQVDPVLQRTAVWALKQIVKEP